MQEHGIGCSEVKLDLATMMSRKQKVVESLCKGIEGLFAKNKISYLKGSGKISGAQEVSVAKEDGTTEVLKTKNIIIATGSEVVNIPGIAIDEDRIVSSTGALQLKKVPKEMVVIGGGYIGLEMSCVWSRLGAKVTVVEFADCALAAMDTDVSKEMQKILQKQGIAFMFSTKVVSAKNDDTGVKIELEALTDGKISTIRADVLLVAVGRKPYTHGLGLENIGITVDARGKIKVDSNFSTAVKGVYAIGDVIDGPMLAHKAEEEGVAVAEIISGEHGHVNYQAIPGIVYTYPEVASVGKTEDELKKLGVQYKVGKFPFMANSRARTNGYSEGFVKIIVDAQDRIIGAHIVGDSAGELIQEIVLAMEFGASAEDIARTSHGHPGLSEAVKEAALAAYSKPLHI
jgi:dihydrolipoamide dehydrogenase